MSPFFLSFLIAAAAGAEAAPASIDAVCDPLARYARDKAHVPVIFADVSDPETDKSDRWLRFKDRRALDRQAKDESAYTQAFVWKQDGGTYVTVFFTSPSGDWAQYVDHCFRPDGSLARSEATLNTFNAVRQDESDEPVSRIRTRYFDPAGHVLRSRKRVVDVKTGKPLKASFADDEETIFRSVQKLPFSALLP